MDPTPGLPMFELRYRVPVAPADAYVAALEQVNADITVGMGRAGRLALLFNRQTDDLKADIVQACHCVHRAIPVARLTGIEVWAA